MIQLIKGFKDILPGEVELWQYIENTAKKIFNNFGFKEIRLPILERAELFAKSIGENTDIVEKEMYTFPDRKGDLVTMRPEATASVVRSYIQHKMSGKDPVRKFYTIGPMFRRERPQKGRYRQFYQINAEVLGIEAPMIDAQLIFILTTLFNELSVTDVKTHINSLGCQECRPQFKETLLNFLRSKTENLCSDCLRRYEKNPLRVLDCKVPSCKEATLKAPSIIDSLCNDCEKHFKTVTRCLDKLQVEYEINKRLVRGLDYYTRTTFEIQTASMGAQNAIAGGGRYDSLTKSLGGPHMPAIGFAIGFDRLAELISAKADELLTKPDLFVAALGGKSQAMAFEWINSLCAKGVTTEMDFSDKSLKSQMKRADRLGSKFVLILGEKEREEGAAILRNMTTREQLAIPLANLIKEIEIIIKNSQTQTRDLNPVKE